MGRFPPFIRWDSRECPGPKSEATLHGSSTRRALTAGAIALAVIAPALDSAEHATEAVTTPPQALPATPENPEIPLRAAIRERQQRIVHASRSLRTVPLVDPPLQSPLRSDLRDIALRAPGERALWVRALGERAQGENLLDAGVQSRLLARRAGPRALRSFPLVRPGATALPGGRPATAPPRSQVKPRSTLKPRSVVNRAIRAVERAARTNARRVDRGLRLARPQQLARTAAHRALAEQRRILAQRALAEQRRIALANRVKHRRIALANRATMRRSAVLRRTSVRNMRAVVAFARAQVGKRYVRGGEGPNGFDCSGFTKRAYARAGLRLPHSSGAQARRARPVSRAKARPGDLVVGRGHVGIYMGRGMMIDAGNSRTGVVYRKLYRGLRVARL